MTVFKHKKKWCVEIETGERTPSGAPRRIRRYARTKTEAQQYERELKLLRDKGLPVPRRDLTVAVYLNDWHQRIASSDRAPATKNNYRHHIDNFLIPQLGHIKLVELHQRHINAMLANIQQTYSPNTARLAKATLSVALQDAVRHDLAGRNVAQLTEQLKVPRRKELRVTPEQLPKVLEAAQNTPFEDVVHLIATTGLRRGEVCALTWGDINLDADIPFANVTKGVTIVDNHPVVGEPKTEGSKRTVALVGPVVDMLRRRRQLVEAEHGSVPPDGFVFGPNTAEPRHPDVITKAINRIGRQAGIDGLGPHQLRHLFTSITMATSDNLAALSKYLGHSNIRTTIDVYGHATQGLTRTMHGVVQQAFQLEASK